MKVEQSVLRAMLRKGGKRRSIAKGARALSSSHQRALCDVVGNVRTVRRKIRCLKGSKEYISSWVYCMDPRKAQEYFFLPQFFFLRF